MVIVNFIPRAEIIPLSGRFRIRVACVRRYRVRINAEGGVGVERERRADRVADVFALYYRT